MSLVQNCTQSITFQGFNAKADNPGHNITYVDIDCCMMA